MANEHPEQPKKDDPEFDESRGPERPYVRDSRKKSYELRRSILDYGMGVIILCIGIVLIIAPKIGLTLDLDNSLRYSLGGLFLLYGGFRVYRGRQKNYYH